MLVTLVVFLAGVAVSWWAATHWIHRPRLVFDLEVGERIDPAELGLNWMTLQMGPLTIKNLIILHLSITNRGRRDVIVPDAGKSASGQRPMSATPLPRIDFSRLGVLGFRTLNSDDSAYWIPLAKSRKSHGDPQHLHIYIHRIRGGSTAHFRILGTVWEGSSALEPSDTDFFPGAIPDVDVDVCGLLRKPYLTK